MNKRDRLFMNLVKFFSLYLFILAVAFAMNPISSQAAKVRTVKITKSINIQLPKEKKQYAKKVVKGKTIVKITNKKGAVNCLYFKVPSTRTWKFIANGLKSYDKDGVIAQTGEVTLGNLQGHGYTMTVKGGKSSNLPICTKAHLKAKQEFEKKYPGYTYGGITDPTQQRYTSRTGTVKLKKGTMVYITFQMQGIKSFNLTID